jgi:general secretion pathway protein G
MKLRGAWGFRDVVAGRAAFTLVELLATMAVIVVLASLILGTMGYVNRKGAQSRAVSEVAALSAAIDSYNLDFGQYPKVNELFAELTGQGTVNDSKVYFEPRGSIATDLKKGPFLDPWGAPYKYQSPGVRNVGFFDLWAEPPDAKDEKDWVHN